MFSRIKAPASAPKIIHDISMAQKILLYVPLFLSVAILEMYLPWATQIIAPPKPFMQEANIMYVETKSLLKYQDCCSSNLIDADAKTKQLTYITKHMAPSVIVKRSPHLFTIGVATKQLQPKVKYKAELE